MKTYSDDYLNRWAEIYTSNPAIARQGIQFMAFLVTPEAILNQVVARNNAENQDDLDIDMHEPLLPHQAVVAQNLTRKNNELAYRNGFLFEKLRHHALPNPNRMRRIV